MGNMSSKYVVSVEMGPVSFRNVKGKLTRNDAGHIILYRDNEFKNIQKVTLYSLTTLCRLIRLLLPLTFR